MQLEYFGAEGKRPDFTLEPNLEVEHFEQRAGADRTFFNGHVQIEHSLQIEYA